MKIAFLSVGVLLQGVALYIAFYSEILGSIYLATLVSVLSICCLMAIRSLIAPVCLFAGVLVGLSISHNELDLQVLTQIEQRLQAMVQAKYKPTQQEWNSGKPLEYLTAAEDEAAEDELAINESISAVE